jgi:hypothetical protein
MILSASAISTIKKVSLTTAGIASVMALGTAGANAATLINSTVGVGGTFTLNGSFSATDTIVLNASGTVDNFEAFGPDGYTTNAAGIVTASRLGFLPGTSNSTGGLFESGSLLISNRTSIQKVFGTNSANGLGSFEPTTNLTRTTTLASIFGSGFTTTNTLDFIIEPYFDSQSVATVGGSPASGGSFASVPNVYTLSGSITSNAGPATSVPEPLTIVGTLIGGTAALRMRKKLKADNN